MKHVGLMLVTILSFTVGYFVHYAKQQIDESNRPIVVTENRLTELTNRPCPIPLTSNLRELLLTQAVFDDSSTTDSDFEINILGDGQGCTFEYAMVGDSYVQGRGAVQFDDNLLLKRIEFFNVLDHRLMSSDEPSFQVFFYHNQKTDYIFETMKNRLFEVNANRGLITHEILPGTISTADQKGQTQLK